MTIIEAVIKVLEDYLRDFEHNDEDLPGETLEDAFEITQAEFPYCDNFPAIHVNLGGTDDEVGVPGMGFVTIALNVEIYVTIKESDLTNADNLVVKYISIVREALRANRYLDNTLQEPIMGMTISKVPSPLGTAYAGTRVLRALLKVAETIEPIEEVEP
jgi:hypothetical protein